MVLTPSTSRSGRSKRSGRSERLERPERSRWLRPAADAAARPRLSRRQELVTMLCGTWLMVGLFVDGWAHNNLAELETFFTPWHALFYSGFAATASWVVWQVRRSGAHRRGPSALPLGYGGALLGVAVFTVGGAGDMAWHLVFGVEQDLEALFSPTHLLLFVGVVLILSAPFRAAWAAEPPGAAPTYRGLLPVLMSLTLTATLVAFMHMYLSAFSTNGPARPVVEWAEGMDPDGAAAHWLQVTVVSSVFFTTTVLVAPLLLLARRWRPPMGTVMTLFTTVAVLTGALNEYELPLLVVAAATAGLGTDLLLRALRPAPERPLAYWATGALVPLVVWPLWFGAQEAWSGVGWAAELWTGTILWSVILGGALALLMLPPAGARAPAPAGSAPASAARPVPPPGTVPAPR